MGSDPDQLVRLIRMAFRPDVRLLLGAMWLFGRPAYEMFVAEESGGLVGTTLVTYPPRAGYISSVSVDPRFRRRGFAQALLARTHAAIRRTRRRYAVLDVISDNAPAQQLYERLGYRPLRRSTILQREPTPGDAPAVPPVAPAGARSFERRDARPLAERATSWLPAEEAVRLPYGPDSFSPPPLLMRAVESQTTAWVIDHGDGPVAFVRASVGGLTRSAHLGEPLVAPDADRAEVRGLVAVALAWIHQRAKVRVIATSRPTSPTGAAALEAAGFVPAFQMDTLALDLPR